MTAGGPPDPQRRALIRILSALGVVVASSFGAQIFFGRSDRSSNAAAPASSVPPVTSASITSATPTTAPSTAPSTTTTTTVTPTPIVIDVISKEGWGGRPTGEFRSHEILRLTYHHTASSGSDPAGAPERIRGYQEYHQAQGWSDVAYHFIIDQAGRVYEGRPVDAAGDTFTKYDPTGHFLVCLDGNFDVDIPTDESLDALALVLAWASVRFDIAAESLTGHRDHSPETTCPGDHAYRHRDELVRRIERIVADEREIRLVMHSA